MASRLSLLVLSLCLVWGPLTEPQAMASPQPESRIRLVVLPFKNLTGHPEQNWLGESFAESLTTSLSQQGQLELIERNQLALILQEQGFGQTALADENQAPRLGKMFGARKMLVGSFQQQGSVLRIQARVVDVETGKIGEGQSIQLEGQTDALFELQANLAALLLQRLGVFTQEHDRATLLSQLKICKSHEVYVQYQQARILLRMVSDKHLSHAIELLEKSLAVEPDFVEAHVALSEAFSMRSRMRRFYASAREDDLNRALFHAQAALNQGKQLDAVYRATARAWQAQKQGQKALNAIRKSLEIRPGDTDSLLALIEIGGQMRLPTSQIMAEIANYQNAAQDPWVQFSLVTLLLSQLKKQPEPDYSQVRLMLDRLRQQLPELAYVPMKQGELALLTQEPEKALKFYQTALAMEPENYLLYAFAGVSLVKHTQYAALAESWLHQSVKLNPEFGYNLAFLGLLALQKQDLTQARMFLRRALDKLPDSPAVLSLLGFVAMQADSYPEAYAYLLQALHNDGNIPGEKMERGSILQSLAALALLLEKPQDALRFSKEALMDPESDPVKALDQLVKIQLSLNQVSEARQEFEAYSQRVGRTLSESEKQIFAWIYLRERLLQNPQDVAVLNDLGSLALKEKDPDEAQTYLQQAFHFAPDHPSVLFNLGLLHLQTQSYAEAIAYFQKVIQIAPEHPKAVYNLGLALQKFGKKAEAKQIWLQLLKSHPEDRQVLKALERLEQDP